MTFIDPTIATTAAVECALWSTADEDGNLDATYTGSDLAPETLENLAMDVTLFIEENLDDLQASGLSAGQIGHDFILTRNHHGAGFWDRGLEEALGNRLTDACDPYGSFDLYVGDDNRLYA